MNELVPSLMWVCPLVFAFGTQIYYLIHNEELAIFIRNWNKLETKLIALPNYIEQHERSQKTHSSVYLIQLIMQSVLLILYICLLILPETTDEQQHDWWTLPANASSSQQLFMMHYPQFCYSIHPLFLVLIHIFSMVFATVFVPLADLVPSLVYDHAATAIQALTDSIQQFQTTMTQRSEEIEIPPSPTEELDLHRIISLYEGIREKVKRADDLFGSIVVFNHGLTFLMVVVFCFSLIFWKEALAYNIIMQLAILFALLIRITISLKLMGRLHSTADPL